MHMIPPRTILAAVDFSDGSRVALACAARLAVQCRAALHVLHAEDPLLHAAAQHEGVDLSRETEEELQRFAGEAWPASTCDPRLHTIAGQAVDVILNAAAREGADVLVIGSRGMSGVERLVFGSTAERVLRRADLPVLVVPPGWAAPQADAPDLSGLGPVIAATDFSASAGLAAAAGAWLAETLHTSLEVVHVVPSPPVPGRWQPHAEASARERVDTARRELATVVRALGAKIPVEARVETGHVPDRIAAVTAPGSSRHPLLVLGRRGGGSRGAAPGATAYRVLTLAAVPVLVYVAER